MDDQQIRERERLRKNPESLQQETIQQRLAQLNPMGGPPRILIGVFGVVFFGAGLCMLGLIWGDEDSSSFPVLGKLFGSLICMAFLAFGGTMVFGAFSRGKGLGGAIAEELRRRAAEGSAGSTAPGASAPGYEGGYRCPFCGAGLGEKADVSPMGDVKCAHCGRWFNVHKNA